MAYNVYRSVFRQISRRDDSFASDISFFLLAPDWYLVHSNRLQVQVHEIYLRTTINNANNLC